MLIDTFSVESFSSFADSGRIKLGPGLNFVVGQNNSGKSALIASLYSFSSNPHRTAENYLAETVTTSKQTVSLIFPPKVLALQARRTNIPLMWPVDNYSEADRAFGMKQMTDFLHGPDVAMELSRFGGGNWTITGGLPYRPMTQAFLHASLGPDLTPMRGSIINGGAPNLPSLIDQYWAENVFFFQAQRYNVGRCPIHMPPRLSTDANNLPAVLMRLKGDRGDVFDELTQHMRDVFPSVRNLSVSSPASSQDLEILVWPTIEQRRRELSVALDESGTGLSQVLAILTVAMTMDKSVILIDEISSFLHPAAAKALVRILESHYPQHQYIISTHSPDVISASNPSAVHLIRKSGFDSSVTAIDLADIASLREVTTELGVSMTDVFASDRIVWVEGPTEEKAFAYLFERTRLTEGANNRRSAPQFTSVVATGDFAKRGRADLIFEIYARLSTAAAAVESSARFAFDREGLTQEQMADLDRRSRGRARFLPRRLFECYLLQPDSIACVLNSELEPDDHVSVEQVEIYMIEHGGDARFKGTAVWSGSVHDVSWLEQVDAANLLKQAFGDLTAGKVHFSKTNHSFKLVKDILHRRPDTLNELVSFVRSLAE